MSKKIKYKLPQEKINELRGFEELMEDIVIESDDRQRKILEREIEKKGQLFELQDYLDCEFKRLNLMDQLLSKQVQNRSDNSQYETLMERELERKQEMQETIFGSIGELDSQFHNALKKVYDLTFSDI